MPDSAPSRQIDRLLLTLCLLGIGALTFVGVSAVMYYRFQLSTPLDNGFEAADTWYHEWNAGHVQIRIRKEGPEDIAQYNRIMDNIVAHAKIISSKSPAPSGYTLISLAFSTTVYLVNMQGHVVYHWSLPFFTAWPNPQHIHRAIAAHILIETAQALPNGDLIVQYAGVGDTPYGYGLAKMDKDSHVLWTYSDNAHHDFYVDEQKGDIYALVQKVVTQPVHGLETMHYPVLTDYIVHLSPEGKEFKRISVALALANSPYAALLSNKRQRNIVWDHLHTNSIMELEPSMADKFPMFHAGDVLISMRSNNTIAVINPDTGEVEWAKTGPWRAQHAARFFPDGRIALFDNVGLRLRKPPVSRVVEFDPATSKITWSYSGGGQNFFSRVHGRIQSMSNGDILVAESHRLHIMEITRDGKTVWDYRLQFPQSNKVRLEDILTARHYDTNELPFLIHKEPSP